MNKFVQLANFHTDIWFFHDELDYDRLEKSAQSLFELLGFGRQKARSAAFQVRKAYYSYDLAVEKPKIKERFFKNVLISHERALKIIGEKHSKISATFHTLWWKEFYQKRKRGILIIPLFIFLNHAFKFDKLNLIPALSCSKSLILAGLKGHNSRDKTLTKRFLTKYWEKMLKKYKIKGRVMY